MPEQVEGITNIDCNSIYNNNYGAPKGDSPRVSFVLSPGYTIGTLKLLANGKELTSSETREQGEGEICYEYTFNNIQENITITFSGATVHTQYQLNTGWDEHGYTDPTQIAKIEASMSRISIKYQLKLDGVDQTASSWLTLEQFKAEISNEKLNKAIYYGDTLTMWVKSTPTYCVLASSGFYEKSNIVGVRSYETEETIDPVTFEQKFIVTFEGDVELEINEISFDLTEITLYNDGAFSDCNIVIIGDGAEITTLYQLKNATNVSMRIYVVGEMTKMWMASDDISFLIGSQKVDKANVIKHLTETTPYVEIVNLKKPYEYSGGYQHSYWLLVEGVGEFLLSESKKPSSRIGVLDIDLSQSANDVTFGGGFGSAGTYLYFGDSYRGFHYMTSFTDEYGNSTDVQLYIKDKPVIFTYWLSDSIGSEISDGFTITINGNTTITVPANLGPEAPVLYGESSGKVHVNSNLKTITIDADFGAINTIHFEKI